MGIGAFLSTLAHEFLHNYVADNPSTTTGDDYQRHQIRRVIDIIQPVVAFMVLCSIIIHGLSIPGFGLGSTVSRTWSRRDTNVAAPDWTNQATLVTQAEDIVINRDLERGEGGRGLPLEKTITLNNDNGADDVDAAKSDWVGKETKDQVDRVSAVTFATTPTQQRTRRLQKSVRIDHPSALVHASHTILNTTVKTREQSFRNVSVVMNA